MGEGFYKKIFLIGALWNVAGGAVIVLLTSQIFAAAHLTPPDPWVYYYSWIALFVTFGIGYYLVYRDMYGIRTSSSWGSSVNWALPPSFLPAWRSNRGRFRPFF
jgi:hypothetical protein